MVAVKLPKFRIVTTTEFRTKLNRGQAGDRASLHLDYVGIYTTLYFIIDDLFRCSVATYARSGGSLNIYLTTNLAIIFY